MKSTFKYRSPDTNSGKLRIPITFYRYGLGSGPEPVEEEKETLYECFCEAYNPSMKDLSIMEHKGTREAVTVKIRDTAGEYLPTNKHFAVLDDIRYSGKVLSVIDVRPDLVDNRFTVILLGVIS